ncbi:MAG TPA: gamma-glutamylcyclotransferase [Pseudorhodoplanes sp.]|jgi:cation transport protein ChaC|nr:gamma-glutamylcyclotransferase [Pseudorhodoplanes sp.]
MNASFDHAAEDLWVFGYGSLMWRPGFAFEEQSPAKVIGLHRSLCVYSFVHRGTPEKPGLVLGLDRGGACRGVAFRVAAGRRAETLAYLRGREQVTKVYRETMRGIVLLGNPERRVEAVCYVVDRSHPQYARGLTIEEQLRHIRQAHGQSGPNPDYVLSTVAALEAMGCHDEELHRLAERLKGQHEPHAEAPVD